MTSDYEVLIPILVRGAAGVDLEIQAVVDTGFSDYLTLPSDLATTLNLPVLDHVKFTLANGTTERMRTYSATVDWDGADRTVIAIGMNGDGLIGMEPLRERRLTLDVTDGGVVTILPLSDLQGY